MMKSMPLAPGVISVLLSVERALNSVLAWPNDYKLGQVRSASSHRDRY